MSHIRIEDCIHAASLVFGVSTRSILGDSRHQDIARVRFAAVHIAQTLTARSTVVIGRAMNRDHTTIMNSLKRAEQLIASDPVYAKRVERAMRVAMKADKDGEFVERFTDQLMDHAKLVLKERIAEDPIGVLRKLLE